jgi:hypothetical protein
MIVPDNLGLVYEGILHFVLIKSGRNPIKPKKGELRLSCRNTCSNSTTCSKTPFSPELFIEPDVLLINEQGDPTHVFYVTHWRNADNFQYKFWRTMAEIYEHKIYIPNMVSVNWIAEPLTHKEGLLRYLRRICDYSFDLGIFADGVSADQAALGNWIDSYRRSVSSTSIDQVVAKCSNEWEINPFFRNFISPLITHASSAAESTQDSTNHDTWLVQRDHCLESRTSAKPRSKFTSGYRTCVQALLLLFGGNPIQINNINPRDLTGSTLLDESKAEILSTAPFRTRNGLPIPLLNKIVDASSKGKPRYELCQEVRLSLRFCRPEVLNYCLNEYSKYCSNHDTWSDYVRIFSCNAGDTNHLSRLWYQHSSEELLAISITDSIPFLFTLLMESVGESLNSFQKMADPLFEAKTGVSLKQVSPYGDTGFHTFRALLYGNHESLKTHGMLREALIESLIECSQVVFSALPKRRNSFQECYLAALGSKVRTYLSKAPNPLLPLIESKLPFGWKKASLEKTSVNDLIGGKTGKTEYDFVNGNHYVKVVTAQDGNEYHKTKELCGRIRSHLQLFRPQNRPKISLILDGDWSDEKVRALSLSGYTAVQSVEDFFDYGLDI